MDNGSGTFYERTHGIRPSNFGGLVDILSFLALKLFLAVMSPAELVAVLRAVSRDHILPKSPIRGRTMYTHCARGPLKIV